ncbi:MAG TPA: proline dehydrogenase family protein [Chloroflexota bacterium]|nr:proline dehydrogenase family protein [Chloroflexota bacterium]
MRQGSVAGDRSDGVEEDTVRGLVLSLAREPHIRAFLTRGPGRTLARRFVAGDTLAEGLTAALALWRSGARVSLDYLGEAVTSLADAEAAYAVYRQTLDHLHRIAVPATLSVKPSQFGIDLSRADALRLLSELVDRAAQVPTGIRLDMEDSSRTDATLWLWDQLRQQGRSVGVVLQAALYRTPVDLERVIAAGGSVRLCKGAYAERATVAHPRKSDVDAAYRRLLERLLDYAAAAPPPGPGGLPPAAIATHDLRLIQSALDQIHTLELPPDRYEFQMLYGVRRDLQQWLIAAGYPLRVYTPWGPSWYPYLSRRLAERPANLLFLLRALLAEAVVVRRSTGPTAGTVRR